MGLVGRTNTILAGGVAVCALFATMPAHAQETAAGGETLLQKLILIAKGEAAGAVSDTPLATQTTAEEIEANQIDDIQDLGNTTEPGVSTGFAGTGVNIRGLDADRVLTTVDGIPIPYLTNGSRQGGPTSLESAIRADGGPSTFDFSTLSAVDIMRGADSSRAGSGALGGAMVLRTLEPDDLIEEGRTFGGIAKLSYDSADQSFGGSAALAARYGDTSVLFQGGYTLGHEADNMGTVGGQGPLRSEPNPSDWDQHNLLFKIRQDLASGHRFGVTAERFRKDTASDLLTEEDASRNFSELDGDKLSERDRISLDYQYEAPDLSGPVDRADFKLYWQKLVTDSSIEGTRVGTIPGPWMRGNELMENSYGAIGSLGNAFDVGTSTHDVTIGGNVSFSHYDQFTRGDDTCPANPAPYTSCSFHHTNQSDMPDVDAWRVGLYADDEITLGDSGFRLTPGVRFDWFSYTPVETADYLANSGNPSGTLPDAKSDYRFSPKLRAEYDASEDVTLFAQWAMAFKAPNVDQLYLNYSTPPIYRAIGNPDLKSETSHGFEIGANIGNLDQGGRVTAFYNRYRNFIDSQTDYTDPAYPGGTTTYENLDRVRIYGFEASAHKRFASGFSLSGSLAYARGVDEQTGTLIDSVPPLKGILGVGYATETWGTDLRMIGVAGVDQNSSASFKPGGYSVVNLTAWWEPETMKGLRLAGGVYNLFDREYYDAVKWRDIDLTSAYTQPQSYYSEPGRSFRLSLTQRF